MTSLRLRQLWQAMRLELRRTFTFWGTLRLLFLAFAPAFIILMHAIHDRNPCNLEEETLIRTLAGHEKAIG